MDPIIRAAAVTAVRRPLSRPGTPVAPGAAEPVRPAVPAAAAPSPADLAAQMAAESAAALADARAMLAQAEVKRQEWEAQEAAARAELKAAGEDLQRREQALEAGQRAHQEALQGAYEEAARRGYEEGLARGTAEGRAGADAAVASRLEQLDALARGMDEASACALVRQEDMLVEVAWTAICRMAGQAAASREDALAIVRTAAAQVRETQGLRVRVHPEDAEWLGWQGNAAGWNLQADPSVALGGCIVESSQGSLDARLELQLERLRDALCKARAMRSTSLAGAQD